MTPIMNWPRSDGRLLVKDAREVGGLGVVLGSGVDFVERGLWGTFTSVFTLNVELFNADRSAEENP